MANNFSEKRELLKQAVIEANTLRKLQNWLNDIIQNDNKDYLAPETVLFYIDETIKYLKAQRDAERRENGK